MDVDFLLAGQRFDKELDRAIARTKVMIVVIGPGTFDARNASGARRIDDPIDYFRIEIEAALARNIPVISVLIRGASMPAAHALPAEIAELSSFVAFRYPEDYQSISQSIQYFRRKDTSVVSRLLRWFNAETEPKPKNRAYPVVTHTYYW